MKIIGETRDGFIFQATKYEIEKLADVYYGGSANLKVGSEVLVSEMYDQVKFLRENEKTVEQVQDMLGRIAKNLERMKPFITPPEVEE